MRSDNFRPSKHHRRTQRRQPIHGNDAPSRQWLPLQDNAPCPIHGGPTVDSPFMDSPFLNSLGSAAGHTDLPSGRAIAITGCNSWISLRVTSGYGVGRWCPVHSYEGCSVAHEAKKVICKCIVLDLPFTLAMLQLLTSCRSWQSRRIS